MEGWTTYLGGKNHLFHSQCIAHFIFAGLLSSGVSSLELAFLISPFGVTALFTITLINVFWITLIIVCWKRNQLWVYVMVLSCFNNPCLVVSCCVMGVFYRTLYDAGTINFVRVTAAYYATESWTMLILANFFLQKSLTISCINNNLVVML